MSDGTLLTVDDRHILRFERRLDHSVDRVWRAITHPDELRHWFPPEDPITVTESEAPRLLAGTWFGDPVRFELEPDGEGCVLVFTHTFDDRDTAARSAAGWDSCFRRMDALLAGEPMDYRDSLDGWSEVHERYAEEFGVDPELGRQAIAEETAKE